jgi:Zn-dependent protease
MNEKLLYDGLLTFVYFIIIVTFHEFGHAWTASKLGDDTARSQGRVTLNPAAHIDFFGTIILPLLAVAMAAFGEMGLFFGWGRPVPVNLANLKHRRRDDILISFAGPAMNVVLAVLALAVAKVAMIGGASPAILEGARDLAFLSMFLFFFNLVPVPPLDGGHIMRNLVGMKEESFLNFSRFGFIIIIVLINIPQVGWVLYKATQISVVGMGKLFALG